MPKPATIRYLRSACGVICKKTVTYFLLKYISGDTSNYSCEVDKAGWFPIEKAEHILPYKSDREIIVLAKERLKSYEENIIA
jgi:predicted NUDIX family NTP pyrophosphohydrolase